MLPSRNRLTTAEDFRRCIRKGQRSGGALLVVHVLVPGSGAGETDFGPDSRPARAGFVVARSVGNAVTRNLVKRRLRHLVRERLELLPDGSLCVVRALPPVATATHAELGAELDAGLHRSLQRSLREVG